MKTSPPSPLSAGGEGVMERREGDLEAKLDEAGHGAFGASLPLLFEQ
jgi:hypothetical protein